MNPNLEVSKIKSGADNGSSDPKIVQEYQAIYEDSVRKYGSNTVVLMQCGTFMELYDYCKGMDEDDLDESTLESDKDNHGNDLPLINNMHEVCEYLGLTVKKNKDRDLALGNPHKGGFGKEFMSGYKNKLLNSNYNVVIVEEFDNEDPNIKRKVRKITEVLTPGVCTEVNNYYANNVLVIYIENQNPREYLRRIDKYELSVGLASIDVSTNESYVYELGSSRSISTSINTCLEEVYRFIQSNRCRELIIHLNGFKLDGEGNDEESIKQESKRLRKYFSQVLELDRYLVQKFTINSIPNDYTHSRFQNLQLKRVYGDDVCGVGTTPLEFLNLECHPFGCCALVLLFDFIRARNESMLDKLSKAVWWDAKNELVLSHNAIEQLDLIPKPNSTKLSNTQTIKSRFRSLYNIINHTTTPMGRRLLEQHILHPLLDSNRIERRYSIVDEIRTVHLKVLDNSKSNSNNDIVVSSKVFSSQTPIGRIRKYLRCIGDIKRLHRKIELGVISPYEVAKLIKSYESMLSLIKYFKDNVDDFPRVGSQVLPKDNIILEMQTFYNVLTDTFELETLGLYTSLSSIDKNVFKEGINKELDDLCEEISAGDKIIHVLAKRCNNILQPETKNKKYKSVVGIKEPKKGGKHFVVNNRYRGVLKHYQNEVDKQFRDLQYRHPDTPDKEVYSQLKIRKYKDIFDFIVHNRDNIRDKALREFMEKNKSKLKILTEDNSDEEDDSVGDEEDLCTNVEYLTALECQFVHHIQYGELKNAIKVFTPLITREESRTDEYALELSRQVSKAFINFVEESHTKYGKFMEVCGEMIAAIDVFISHAITSIKYNYSRPCVKELSNDEESPSYIRAKGIRHPIIERIQEDIAYVPNDINIGRKTNSEMNPEAEEDTETCGLFLLGLNNGGKTTYLKSVGLNLVLAQIGSFVAGRSFEYRPFRNIITRLSGNDNMWKSQGSFAVEMSELRTVMNQSTVNSLVLGDEICHGTEQKSALAIVGASAIRLCKRRTNFIFSTHLRLLPNIPEVNSLPNLKFAHFLATPNHDTEEIEYGYKLIEGLGESMYGIEIAEAMGVDKEMCSIAYDLRKRIEERIVVDDDGSGNRLNEYQENVKTSVYNTGVYIRECTVDGCNRKVDDSHHIHEQQTANALGQIEHFHKNEAHNLVGLCKLHHQQVHEGLIDVCGFVMTTKGVRLKIRKIDK